MSDTGRGEEVRLEIRIEASPETVFALLTDPARMRTWLAELVEADSRPGGVFRISGPSGVSIEGTYLEVIPNKKVVFTWGGVEGVKPGQSTVEFLLEPDGGAHWCGFVTTDCHGLRWNRIAAAGSIPVWSSSRMPPRGARRLGYA